MTKLSQNDSCPLGDDLQHYWDRLSDKEKMMRFDREGLFSLALESVALDIAKNTPGNLIVDAFCGVGGSAIGFARTGKNVVAIDFDNTRLDMARYNASFFNVEDKIEFIHGDSTEIIPKLNPDNVFLDPPWGGTNYNQSEYFHLEDFEPDGTCLLNLSFSITDSVVIRLPKNFNFKELDSIGRKYEIARNIFKGKLLHYCAYFR